MPVYLFNGSPFSMLLMSKGDFLFPKAVLCLSIFEVKAQAAALALLVALRVFSIFYTKVFSFHIMLQQVCMVSINSSGDINLG